MLRYLDNADNAAGHLNENYAREIMELHTMGVGSGYTQADVEALARILTGVGIDLKPEDPKLKPELQSQLVREGAFEFNPARHDYGDKTFLGHTIKGRGLAEVDEAVDILVRHPATATHLARQIATYFVSENPPEPLVQRMAQTFKTTDGDIAAVLSTMVHAPEFTASLKSGAKFKDPVQYVFSAVRLAYDDKVILNTAADPELAQSSWRRVVQSRDAGWLCDDFGILERAGTDDGAFRDRAANRFGFVGPVQAGGAERGRSAGFPADCRIRSTSTDCGRPWARQRWPRSIRRSRRRTGIRCFCRRPSSCAKPLPLTKRTNRDRTMNRRDLIKAFAAAAPLTVAGRVWAAPATDARLLVVFLRGAYDAANVVVPVSSDFYHNFAADARHRQARRRQSECGACR